MRRPGFDRRRGQMIPGGLIGEELQRAATPTQAGPPAQVVGNTVGFGPAPDQGALVALPPSNFPPEGVFPVYEIGDGDVAPSATAIILTFTVPGTRTLRVNTIGFGADDETALRFLTWRFNVDTQPVPGYFAVPATIGTISQPATVILVVPGPATVTVQVTVAATANVTYRYLAAISGYLYGRRT